MHSTSLDDNGRCYNSDSECSHSSGKRQLQIFLAVQEESAHCEWPARDFTCPLVLNVACANLGAIARLLPYASSKLSRLFVLGGRLQALRPKSASSDKGLVNAKQSSLIACSKKLWLPRSTASLACTSCSKDGSPNRPNAPFIFATRTGPLWIRRLNYLR